LDLSDDLSGFGGVFVGNWSCLCIMFYISLYITILVPIGFVYSSTPWPRAFPQLVCVRQTYASFVLCLLSMDVIHI